MSNFTEHGTTKPAVVYTDALAEPGPDWPIAKRTWGVAWHMHWIGFGILFGLLAVHSFLVIIFANRKTGFCRKPLFLAINLLLFFLGATRAVYLLLDPYESRQNGVKDPKWLTLLLFGIAYPCLTSSFCLIHLAFLEVTKLQIGPRKLQSLKFLSSVILIHFIIVFTAETTASIKPELKTLLIVCQSFFILWSLILSGSFIYSGFKLVTHVKKVQHQLEDFDKNMDLRKKTKPKSCNTKVAKITLATSFLGFAVCSLHFYSMIGVYGMYSEVVHPSPWPWLAFQSSFRFVELAMACTIAYSVIQRGETPKKGRATSAGAEGVIMEPKRCKLQDIK
ncbi:proline-rich transmembrane protein 4-like [Montipora capricornis]|uniref:proline-rich transmembrane protein 4-like n=1 Tax=Montipora foliosa TaxID=591990 RepID=UPI0035F113DA